jgi:hypothetical protein
MIEKINYNDWLENCIVIKLITLILNEHQSLGIAYILLLNKLVLTFWIHI